jgi:hypothetical protein
MRKALIVGIDYYDRIPALAGCVNDASAVKSVLERHADGTTNFTTPEILLGATADSAVTKQELKEAVRQLFYDDADIALLYFAGHGYTEDTGGFLCASDCATGDDGLPLAEVMTFANKSQAKNKVIVLDSCHSGIAGDSPIHDKFAEVAEGMTILSASGANQYALEVAEGGAGVFREPVRPCASGRGGQSRGRRYARQRLLTHRSVSGPWSQRPVFKTNVERFVSLRRAQPPIPLDHLRAVTKYFPRQSISCLSTPRTSRSAHPISWPTRRFRHRIPPRLPSLQSCRRRHSSTWSARSAHSTCGTPRCRARRARLTVLGQHYWNLVDKGLL